MSARLTTFLAAVAIGFALPVHAQNAAPPAASSKPAAKKPEAKKPTSDKSKAKPADAASAASSGDTDVAFGAYQRGYFLTAFREASKRVTESNDPRSYRVNSDRLLATGFRPKKSVDDAIGEIIQKYRKGELKDDERFYNLKWMQKEVVK